MFNIKFTKIIVLMAIFMGYNNCLAQFNTVKKPNDGGVVSMLSIIDSVKVDSVVTLVKKKKIEYNMGVLPLEGIYVTSFYGKRVHPLTGVYSNHRGVDLRAVEKMVYAVQTGIITEVGYDDRLGEYVKLLCGTFEFIYGHLEHIYVTSGSTVQIGDMIGKTGGTGNVTAEHLHFAIKRDGEYIDPYPILQLIYENLDLDIGAAGNDF